MWGTRAEQSRIEKGIAMDLNDIKNRAKDLLADLTDNRPDREEQPGPGRADDAADDSAVRTDRLEPPLQRPATDPQSRD